MFKFILPITFIFFAASLYFSYIGPGFNKIDVINKDIDALKDTLSIQKEEVKEKLADLKEQMDSITLEDEEKLDRLVPEKNDFDEARFVYDMNTIAFMHNMRIDKVQFSSQPSTIDSDSRDYGTFQMRFNVEGAYDKFIAFMEDIERNEQLIDVNITSFQSKETGIYNYGVSLVTYWLN